MISQLSHLLTRALPKTRDYSTCRWRSRLESFGVVAAVLMSVIITFLCGCSSVEVTVAEDVSPRPVWTVLVLPLDDSGAAQAVADYTFYGRTGAQGSGPVIAREFKRALVAYEGFRHVERDALRRVMKEEKLKVADLAVLGAEGVCRVGRAVKAGMVVIGRVHACRTAWFLFIPRARVHLAMRGLDPETATEVWRAEAKGSATFSTDSQLAVELTEKIAAEVQKDLTRANSHEMAPVPLPDAD